MLFSSLLGSRRRCIRLCLKVRVQGEGVLRRMDDKGSVNALDDYYFLGAAWGPIHFHSYVTNYNHIESILFIYLSCFGNIVILSHIT